MLALKGNHEKLRAAVAEHFEQLHKDDFEHGDCRRRQTKGNGHGRVEKRYYYHAPLPEGIKPLAKDWKGLTTIGQVVSITERDGKETTDVRYYLTSLKLGVKRFARAVRGHRGIENSLHWVLDVTWGEDQSRARDRRLADNLAAFDASPSDCLSDTPPSTASKENSRSLDGTTNS
ncbi:hypothetical protein KOR34_01290 [Posidoniimonas corsicana]|uniref:Uncharacterized protein n=1 Tax=Posidoniimonas corsicana TaxID=1938618 RepID=A0A5C5VAA8_9BACT|nr:hypothetical protein KOR34_01290 [Posidoniimonas corsicana]